MRGEAMSISIFNIDFIFFLVFFSFIILEKERKLLINFFFLLVVHLSNLISRWIIQFVFLSTSL